MQLVLYLIAAYYQVLKPPRYYHYHQHHHLYQYLDQSLSKCNFHHYQSHSLGLFHLHIYLRDNPLLFLHFHLVFSKYHSMLQLSLYRQNLHYHFILLLALLS